MVVCGDFDSVRLAASAASRSLITVDTLPLSFTARVREEGKLSV